MPSLLRNPWASFLWQVLSRASCSRLLFMGAIYLYAKRNPEKVPRGEAFTLKEKMRSLKGTIGMLALFALILGGILGGFFSPTEGGAVGAFGAFLISLLRRRLTWQNLMKSFEDTAKITCRLFIILIGVGVLGYFLAATQLPFLLADLVTGFSVSRYVYSGCRLCPVYHPGLPDERYPDDSAHLAGHLPVRGGPRV
ncbi:MAG: TRAP transporter large permease subunit [Bacillota bacterium]